jgi:4-amino-4-deoxy-L-arabinose transferase-like glycosyltransferase
VKKLLAFVLLTSLLLRIWFAIGYWGNKPLTHDSQEYLELAKSLNETGRFELPVRQTLKIESYGRAPGYPVYLAFLLRISPTLSWVRLAEALLNLFSSYLFFLIAREMFGLRVGIIAFVLSSFYLPLIVLAPVILSENLWLCCILLSYWLLWRKHTTFITSSFTNLILVFGLLSIATLIRPGTIFLLPFYFIWARRKTDLKSALILAGLYFLILLPWNIHLMQKEDQFIFVASEGGVTFWTGTHPEFAGDGDLAVNPAVQKDYRRLLETHKGLTSAERSEIYTESALRNIFEHPGRLMQIELKKLIYWILPLGPSVMKMSLLHRIASFVFYLPLLIFAIFGFRRLAPDAKFFVAGIYISFTAMILIFFPQERFRIATVDPILILVSVNEIAYRFFNPHRAADPAKDAIIGV